MKTLIENINLEMAKNLKEENSEYLIWADGTEITEQELTEFMLTYTMECINLEHKTKDFRIEDIIY